MPNNGQKKVWPCQECISYLPQGVARARGGLLTFLGLEQDVRGDSPPKAHFMEYELARPLSTWVPPTARLATNFLAVYRPVSDL